MNNSELKNKLKQWVVTYWRVLAGVVGLAAMIMYSGGWFGEKVQPGKGVMEQGVAVKPGHEVVVVARTNTPAKVFVFGTVASEVQVNLNARIPATVVSVKVSAGDRVKKDQLLVALDDRELREQNAAAEAQFKHAETEYQRASKLFEKAATTDQALTAAESAFTAAKAQLERMKVMLSYASVVAPMDGVVTDRRIEAGDLVGPGQTLLAVYDPSRMRLEVPVPVRLTKHLAMGQEVSIALEKCDELCKGKVTEIVSEIDPASRTQTVKIQLAGAVEGVLPGTFGRLLLNGESRETLLVPATATYRVGQLEMVQVVQSGRAMRRMVTTGERYEAAVEILSGLNAGETVLVNPGKGE